MTQKVAAANAGPSTTSDRVAAFCTRRWRRQRVTRENREVDNRLKHPAPLMGTQVPPPQCRDLTPVMRPGGHGSVAVLHQFAAACHANIEVRDLLAQRISIDAE